MREKYGAKKIKVIKTHCFTRHLIEIMERQMKREVFIQVFNQFRIQNFIFDEWNHFLKLEISLDTSVQAVIEN